MSGSPISGESGSPKLLPPVEPIGPHDMLLHVGVHKTGTTAIQAALADARPQLAEHGVTYPGRKQAQHGAALAVIERTWGWKERGGRPPDLVRFDTLAKQSRAARGRVVASSEFFCEANADQTAFVAERLGTERLHVVITLRNLGRLLPSSWQQYLKYGLMKPYDEWLQAIFETPGKSKVSPSFWRRNDHAKVVANWASAVGPERVTVLVLEDVGLSAQFHTFAQMLAVPEPVLVERMNLTSNRSMTAAEAELLVRLNGQVKDRMQWDEYVRLVRRGVALGMVERREPGKDEPRLHTPDWALDAAAEQGRLAADAIGASGVQVVGDLDLLRTRISSPPPVSDADRESIPVDAAVQALATLIDTLHAEADTRELARALVDNVRADVRRKLPRGKKSKSKSKSEKKKS